MILFHEKTITSDSFPLGAMNNVVEGTVLGEIYITQFLPAAISKKCLGHGHRLEEVKSAMKMFFSSEGKVHRCVWDPNQPEKETFCEVAAEGLKAANGITTDPERKTFFVVGKPL